MKKKMIENEHEKQTQSKLDVLQSLKSDERMRSQKTINYQFNCNGMTVERSKINDKDVKRKYKNCKNSSLQKCINE